MTKLDRISKSLNGVLSIIYIPLSFFSWLSMMVSEGAIDVTNPLYVGLNTAFCVVAFLVPLLCVAGIVISARLRVRGYSLASVVVQCLPFAVFALNILLLAVAESLPKTL